MNNENNYIIIDTEGKTILTEISIIDSQGNLISQGFNHDLERRAVRSTYSHYH